MTDPETTSQKPTGSGWIFNSFFSPMFLQIFCCYAFRALLKPGFFIHCLIRPRLFNSLPYQKQCFFFHFLIRNRTFSYTALLEQGFFIHCLLNQGFFIHCLIRPRAFSFTALLKRGLLHSLPDQNQGFFIHSLLKQGLFQGFFIFNLPLICKCGTRDFFLAE